MIDMYVCPIDHHGPLELYEAVSEGAEVKDGAFFCVSCNRFFPIVDQIPIMLPDNLRKREDDLDFLAKWNDKLPAKIIKQGMPWHL